VPVPLTVSLNGREGPGVGFAPDLLDSNGDCFPMSRLSRLGKEFRSRRDRYIEVSYRRNLDRGFKISGKKCLAALPLGHWDHGTASLIVRYGSRTIEVGSRPEDRGKSWSGGSLIRFARMIEITLNVYCVPSITSRFFWRIVLTKAVGGRYASPRTVLTTPSY
jgi:hypothetical protein